MLFRLLQFLDKWQIKKVAWANTDEAIIDTNTADNVLPDHNFILYTFISSPGNRYCDHIFIKSSRSWLIVVI